MRAWKAAGVLAGVLLSGIPIFAEGPCAKKRVDACGCHHVYGVRHCHPNRRTKNCAAPASAHLPPLAKAPGESL
jgi:hypothetical protein